LVNQKMELTGWALVGNFFYKLFKIALILLLV